MKKVLTTLLIAAAALVCANATVPHKFAIPDIPGYVTLKGDFHVHTVFSDDTSWPTSRIDEAYYDGLDVISITDHCDTRHRHMVKKGYFNPETCTRNASYEIALDRAKRYGIIVLHGAELTRGERLFPGHFNAHFLQDGDVLATKMEAQDPQFAKDKDKTLREETALLNGLKEARAQGAFLVWNHPNWEPQEPNEVVWHPFHEKVYKAGLMDGIEIENHSVGFCPEAFHWAMEKNLTIVSGTDCHVPMNQLVDYELGEFRPFTLIFATERSEKAVREALDNHRTAVCVNGSVYGKEEFLKPLLKGILSEGKISYSAKKIAIKVKNTSSVPVCLRKGPRCESLVMDRVLTINPGEECSIGISAAHGASHFASNEFEVNFYVENFLTDVDAPVLMSYKVSLPEKYRK